MAIFPPSQIQAARWIGQLGQTNPFLKERIALERAILGDRFEELNVVWQVSLDEVANNPNVVEIGHRAERLAADARAALAAGRSCEGDESRVYEELILYVLYYRYERPFFDHIASQTDPGALQIDPPDFTRFAREVAHFFHLPGMEQRAEHRAEHLFAVFFTLRRAFHFTFRHILGASIPAARLRARVWESAVTVDTRRFLRSLFDRMHTIPTLITGPSGTGKELVAAAIGLSRHIAFDPDRRRFVEDFKDLFLPINLSAMAPTLIEAELFGHAKGAFTGAAVARAGFLEERGAGHTVFLDEIGEVTPEIQVKLLRLLQTGDFFRLGDRTPRRFNGKVVTATNRCLADEITYGSFRADLYYRLCADVVTTPSLSEQLTAAPGELETLVGYLARKIVGPEESAILAAEALTWIEGSVPSDYRWPGNIRELEQCIRGVLVSGAYVPALAPARLDPSQHLAAAMGRGELSADELVGHYCELLYDQTGSYQQVGRIAGLDRRTVKSKIDALDRSG